MMIDHFGNAKKVFQLDMLTNARGVLSNSELSDDGGEMAEEKSRNGLANSFHTVNDRFPIVFHEEIEEFDSD